MTDDEFKGVPPESKEEWRRFYRMLHEHEEARPTIRALVAVTSGAKVIKAVLPYAIVVGAMLLTWINRVKLGLGE